MKRLLICAAAATLLSGCMLDRETRMAKHQETCAGYGFPLGTTAFAQCMQNEETNWQARHTAAMNQLQQQNYQQQQLNLQQQQLHNQQMQQIQNNYRANCMSNRIGNNVYTTCN
ncbi:hypothetical protein [Ferrovibrio sp.]|uniref:hypothetical protein n=1 Tax=Ferrovibrio sp. TaxID=1917215 RepID=UPI00312026D6